MKKLIFTKINGAGNDFILIDFQKNEEIVLSPENIIKMCNRRKGIGADGVLLIKHSDHYDYELEYYNSDGSIGSLCGNGARCSIKYVFDNYKPDKNEVKFLCNREIFYGSRYEGDLFTFHLNNPTDIIIDKKLVFMQKTILFNFADTGSPHAVFLWDDIKHLFDKSYQDFNIHFFGREIRYSDHFAPIGTNVNVVKIKEDSFFIRTYERGVEEETLACGTGAVASALILNKKFNINAPIGFTTVDNDKLIVNFEENNDIFSKITLTGPTKINYIGSYNF